MSSLTFWAACTTLGCASDHINLQVKNLADKPITLAASSCGENHTVSGGGGELALDLAAPAHLWVLPANSGWKCGAACPGCFYVETSNPTPGEAAGARLGLRADSKEPVEEHGKEAKAWESVASEEGGADSKDEYRGYGDNNSSTLVIELVVLRRRNVTQTARLSVLGSLTNTTGGAARGDGKEYGGPGHGHLPPWRCHHMCHHRCHWVPHWHRWRCMEMCTRECAWR